MTKERGREEEEEEEGKKMRTDGLDKPGSGCIKRARVFGSDLGAPTTRTRGEILRSAIVLNYSSHAGSMNSRSFAFRLIKSRCARSTLHGGCNSSLQLLDFTTDTRGIDCARCCRRSEISVGQWTDPFLV